MEPEILDAGVGAHALPRRLGPGERQRIPFPAHPAQPLIAVDRDVGEHEFRVLSLQREKDFPNGVGNREYHPPAALTYPHDLPRPEIHFGPSERYAFLLAQSTGANKPKERFIIGAHGLIN